MNRTMSLLVPCCAFFLSVGALGKTPDGQTPAEESVCSGLTGAAFGLCALHGRARPREFFPIRRIVIEHGPLLTGGQRQHIIDGEAGGADESRYAGVCRSGLGRGGICSAHREAY